MTRINIVPPSELSNKHLVAEYHELPRIFTLVKKAIAKGLKPENFNLSQYTLGTGHVKFFYGRLKFVSERYIDLVDEMIKRKMRPKLSGEFKAMIHGIPKEWFGEWKPTAKAISINRKRIEERIEEAKNKPKRKVLTMNNIHLINEDGEVK